MGTAPRQSVMKPKPKQVGAEVRKERGKTMAQLDDILSSLPGEEPALAPDASFAPSVAPIQYHAPVRHVAAEPVYSASCTLSSRLFAVMTGWPAISSLTKMPYSLLSCAPGSDYVHRHVC